MSSRIEDYALIGDCHTAALVGRDGSIDWLCFPRFDAGACFAAILGSAENGRWKIAPACEVKSIRRAYRDGTLVLETEYSTEAGRVALIDFMPPRTVAPDVVRIVEGREGAVPMRMDLTIRFDYGWVVPWVRHADRGIRAIAGPDSLELDAPVETRGEDFHTVAEFTVRAGQRLPFSLTWHPSHEPAPERRDADESLRKAEAWWRDWSSRCRYEGDWPDAVGRSLITLKALTYKPTGGIVAAATTNQTKRRANRVIWASSGVVSGSTPWISALMRPISVSLPVATTTPVPWPAAARAERRRLHPGERLLAQWAVAAFRLSALALEGSSPRPGGQQRHFQPARPGL